MLMNNTIRSAANAKYWTYNPKGKQTIVAIHGLRGTHHGLQFIADQLPDYRFIIPDLPGFGDSQPLEKSSHDIKGYSSWLAKFLDELNLPESPVLLGHSFGSLIVSEFAAVHPKALSKLILINPISKHGNPLGGHIAKGYYGLGNILPRSVGEKLLRSRLVTRFMTETMLTTRQKDLRARVHEQHFAYFATFANRRTVQQTFRATLSGSVLKNAHTLKMPVLIIVGEKDKFVPLKGQKHLHKSIPHADFKVIKSVGHLVHYETPEAAAEHISSFLSNSDK